MFYVYLIQAINFPSKKYIGYTTRHRPWNLIVCLAFENENKAKAFEKHLKSGSVNAFEKKRFW